MRSLGAFYLYGPLAGFHKRGWLARRANRDMVVAKAGATLKELESAAEFLREYIRRVKRRQIR